MTSASVTTANARVPELHLTMTLRNNRVLSRRTELGLTAKAAAEKCGVGYGAWIEYERMKKSPYGRAPGFGGRIGLRPQAQKIAKGLGVPVEWLWPEAVLSVVCPTVVQEMDAQDLRPALMSSQMRELPASADERIERVEAAESLMRWLNVCTPREERVLRLKFGLPMWQCNAPRCGFDSRFFNAETAGIRCNECGGKLVETSREHTIVEIAKLLKISPGRVHQIVRNGLAKLSRAARRDEKP